MTKQNKKQKKRTPAAAASTPTAATPPEVFPIQEVRDLDIAFPASVSHLMPAYRDIPTDFENRPAWEDLASRWFFSGLKGAVFLPKEGVDTSKALRHLQCIMGSFEPKHEHKMLGVAYLLSQWFKEIRT